MKVNRALVTAVVASQLVALNLAHAKPVPVRIAYTGHLAENGSPVKDAEKTITVELFSATTGGSSLWTESHTKVSIKDGLFSITLGSETSFPTGAFDGSARYLQIKVDGQTMLPRIAVVSVPYALRATSCETVGTLTSSSIQQTVKNKCTAGQAIRTITPAGVVTCESVAAAGGVTQVAAGDGLSVVRAAGKVTVSVNATVQRRHAGGVSCSAGSYVTSIDAKGLATCKPDAAGIVSLIASAGVTQKTVGGTATIGLDDAVVARKNGTANQAFDTTTLYLDYVRNRVGVGTATPGQTLDVAGNVAAASFRYQKPRTGYHNIAGSTFTAEHNNDEKWTAGLGGFGFMTGGSPPYRVPLAAPVNLPDGATIRVFTCYRYDNATTGGRIKSTATAHLVRRDLLTQTGTSIAAVTIGTAVPRNLVVPVSDASPVTPIVDNKKFMYSIFVDFETTKVSSSTKFRWYGCRIQYELSAIEPS